MAFLKIAKVNWIRCFLPSSNNPLPISQRAIKWLNQSNVSHQNSNELRPFDGPCTPHFLFAILQSRWDFLRYISTQASKLVRKKHSVATVKGPAQVARSPAKISFRGSSGAYWFFCVYTNIYIITYYMAYCYTTWKDLKSRWRNSHLSVYQRPFPIICIWEWDLVLSCTFTMKAYANTKNYIKQTLLIAVRALFLFSLLVFDLNVNVNPVSVCTSKRI